MGGEWTVQFEGQRTGYLPFDADAAEVDIGGSSGITCTIAGLRSGSAANACTALIEVSYPRDDACTVFDAAASVAITNAALIFDCAATPDASAVLNTS